MSVFIADLIDHMSENYFCESEVVSLNYMENYTHTQKSSKSIQIRECFTFRARNFWELIMNQQIN